MNKIFRFSILVICFLLTVNFTWAQKGKTKAVSKPVAQTKVDLGILRQNTYTNDFFELKIEFPFGWLVGDNMLEAQLLEIQLANADAKTKLLMSRLTPLLGGYRALPGSTAENSNLKIVVESLAAAPQIKTDTAYLTNIRAGLNAAKKPAGFTYSFIKNELIDGQALQYIETNYKNNRKRSYVIVKKGFALLLTIDAYSQKDFEELHNVLKAADLDYKKQN